MEKYVVIVEWNTDNYLWNNDDEELGWKGYVCQDFDDNVVILEGYKTLIGEATWWCDAKDILQCLDDAISYDDIEGNENATREAFLADTRQDYAKDKAIDVWNFVRNNDRDIEDPETVMQVAMLLYPRLKLKMASLHSQGDFVDAIYVEQYVDADILADWYFGDIYEATVYTINDADIDEDFDITDAQDVELNGTLEYTNYICESEYDHMRYGKNFTHEFAEFMDVPEDQMTVIEK